MPNSRNAISAGDDCRGRRSLRVVQVSTFFPSHGGGLEAVAGRLAEELVCNGLEVIWFAGKPATGVADLPCLHLEPVNFVDPLESWFGAPMPLWGLAAVRRLNSAIRRADLVHIHDYVYFGSLIAFWLARAARRPVVVTQHIGKIQYRSWLARSLLEAANRLLGRRVLELADAVAFVSPSVQRYFETLMGDSTHTHLVMNGVDHDNFRVPTFGARQLHRQVLQLDDTRTTLLFVGRFVERKGILLLEHVARALPNIDWLFVGWGPLSPIAWRLPNVRVISGLRGAEIAPYYQAADLLVLPSYGEGFPLVVQESLACGTPVAVGLDVAKSVARLDEGAIHVVSTDSAEHLTRQIGRLAANRAQLEESRASAANVATQWSWSATVARYMEIYRQADAVPR